VDRSSINVKIDALVGDVPQSFEYGDIFCREDVGAHGRLKIGLNGRQDACVRTLTSPLAGPFQLLYVLHTSRTDAQLGRYESPDLDETNVREFLDKFGRFLSEDARHDIWVRSHSDDATIVLDRHNVVYASGPLNIFEAALHTMGIVAGGTIQILGNHFRGTSSRFAHRTFRYHGQCRND
jgi:hypothetical protein